MNTREYFSQIETIINDCPVMGILVLLVVSRANVAIFITKDH